MAQTQSGSAPRPVEDALTLDERAELEVLRRENSTLRAAVARPPRRRIRWRSVVAVVLVVLGCLLAPASLVAVWTRGEVSDTEQFVATVGPLIGDPAVQEALTNRVTTTVFEYVDVEGLAAEVLTALQAQGLPPQLAERLSAYTPALATGVTGFVRDRVAQLAASPQFAAAWDQALRVSHEQLVAVLSGNSETVVVQGGTVYLELAPFIRAAKERLSAEGLRAADLIPDVNPTIALAPADQLVRAQSAYSALNSVATVLPWVTVLLLAVGVYLARVRMRALVGAGLGVALALVLLAAGLLVARALLVGAVPVTGAAAAASGFDILVSSLRTSGRVLLVLALVVALGAFLAGSSATARGLRGWAGRVLGDIRGGRTTAGPVGTWVAAHVRGLRIGAVALAAVLFVFLPQPTPAAILVIATLLLVVLAGIEFLARPGREPAVPAPEPTGPDTTAPPTAPPTATPAVDARHVPPAVGGATASRSAG